jgi:hypothetical protein
VDSSRYEEGVRLTRVQGYRHQRFEDLRGRQANLGSNCLSGKIRGVHFLLTQFPADSQLIP